MNLFDIDPWLLHVVCNCKQKENCLLPIDNHLRYSQEIDQEFNQSVVYNSIESYKRSYFLFFFSGSNVVFLIYVSEEKTGQWIYHERRKNSFFCLSFDDTQKESNMKCHIVFLLMFILGQKGYIISVRNRMSVQKKQREECFFLKQIRSLLMMSNE
jgi:hypothetical protein